MLSTARQNAAILVVLLAAQLLLMSWSVKDSGRTTILEGFLMRLGSPVVGLGQLTGGGLRGLWAGGAEIVTAMSRNVVLLAEVERLSEEAVRLREADRENRRLRRLLGMREQLVPESIAASVVTSNVTGRTRMIVVDRGSADGVRVDLPVVTWGGAVGRVVVVGTHHAKVRLLTDANSGVSGTVQRSGAQGIILGRAESTLDMLYVPRFSDVILGDRIVTSGLDGVFPRGFGVGRVSSISESADGAQTIHLEPELDYRALQEVLIVLEAPSGGLLDPPRLGKRG